MTDPRSSEKSRPPHTSVTTADVLAWWAERAPDRIAHTVIAADGTESDITYGAWHRESLAVAAGLTRRGVTAASYVGLAFARGQTRHLAACLTAVHRLGAAAVLLPADDAPAARQTMAAITPLVCVVAAEREAPTGPWPPGLPVLDADELLTGCGAQPPAAVPDGTATALVVFTSGTTGTPKGVGIAYADLMARAPRTAAAVGAHPASSSVHLNAFQPSTAAGQWVALAPLLLGVRMITAVELTPASLIGTVQRHGVHEISMVPAMAALLSGIPPDNGTHTATVERITMGTARCPTPVLERVTCLFPRATIRIEYAGTESGFAGTGCTWHPGLPPDTVGHPNAGTRIRITDDLGDPLPPGRAGRVELAPPPGVPPRRYEGDPEATASTFRGSWVRMADIGYLDDGGNLHLVGRAQDFINVSGRKVPCADIERAVERHPAVRESAAFAMPDEMLGEEVAIAVTTGEKTAAEDIRRFAAAELPAHAVPTHVLLIDELPRTRNGKIRRELLSTLLDGARGTTTGEQAVEERLARIVSDTLGITLIDHDRSLLELGASSLQILRVYFALVEEIGADFDINLLFLGDSLPQIARDITAATSHHL
ncbi:AMP-binding protein [Streptomyces sp. NPDC096068]|uniref:AMP-binding protein n=1 Tax=Streptomyces sp. NPDC096068 TaxID=3155424 RepID=UPI0033320121